MITRYYINKMLNLRDLSNIYINFTRANIANGKFYIYVNDLKKGYDYNDIQLLELFNIIPNRVITFSEYANIIWIYTIRLVELGLAYAQGMEKLPLTDNLKKIRLDKNVIIVDKDSIIFNKGKWNNYYVISMIDSLENITDVAQKKYFILNDALHPNKPKMHHHIHRNFKTYPFNIPLKDLLKIYEPSQLIKKISKIDPVPIQVDNLIIISMINKNKNFHNVNELYIKKNEFIPSSRQKKIRLKYIGVIECLNYETDKNKITAKWINTSGKYIKRCILCYKK